ncbi:MAG: sulfurtransferase [Phycisphaerales bacterium]|nr:sulfurtransferase [Phycisphaerales bacterium]
MPENRPLEITPQELQARRGTSGPLLLDCREHQELQFARIEGALHIPMGEIPLRLAEIPEDCDLVVFCHSGVRSMNVAHWLRTEAGLERVQSLRGGIDAWSREIDPTIARY